MTRIIAASAVAVSCLALVMLGFFHPPAIIDRLATYGGSDISFGGTERFTLSQPFASSMDNLSGFGLAINNPAGRSFSLRVLDAAGEVKAQAQSESHISGFQDIVFPPIGGSAGKRYLLEIRALDAGPRIDFFGGKLGGDVADQLLANGAPTQSSLFLQPIVRIGSARRGAILLERVSMRKPWPYSPTLLIALHTLLLAAVFGVAISLFRPSPRNRVK